MSENLFSRQDDRWWWSIAMHQRCFIVRLLF